MVPRAKAASDLLIPLALSRRDEVEEVLILGEFERDLLEGYQCACHDVLASVLDIFYPATDRPSVQGSEDEGVGDQSRGPHGQDNWSYAKMYSGQR